MICTVSGVFKDDPQTICAATTPTLKQLHPGYSTKEKDGVKKTFVAGSPLWDKDPEQQLAYFGERRWIRRFAPDACMGMYTREEIDEIDEYRAARGESVPLDPDRLGQLATGEGWGEGEHLDTDLAAIAPEEPDWTDEGFEQIKPEPKQPTKPPHAARRKPVQARKPAARGKARPVVKTRSGKPARPKSRPLARAEVTGGW